MRSWPLIFCGLLVACGAGPHYTNRLNPSAGQQQFDQDSYACMRENQNPSAAAAGSYAAAGVTVNSDMAQACMAAHGWQEIPRSFLQRSEYFWTH
jgi:hypothetical protein